ncbi:MAG: hypothetical protein IPL98_15555 [Saprospiraceae bacterium]|nr:hypothetical protein [Saprospiraceae bacterium]
MEISLCFGENFNGHSNQGIYIDSFTSIHGCDSIIFLDLKINPIYNLTNSISICEGENYLGHAKSGFYIDSFKTSLGCDSIINLNLKVNPNQVSKQNVFLCPDQFVLIQGNKINSPEYIMIHYNPVHRVIASSS